MFKTIGRAIKRYWKFVLFTFFNWAYRALYNFIDENKDGYLSDEEIKLFIKKLRDFIKLLKEPEF